MNAEEKLHSAMCNAAILLNNGDEIAPRVSSILREALFNYTPDETARAIQAGKGDSDPMAGKYGDVLRPFVALMERELHANAGKGDRPGWLQMDAKTGLLEIWYHVSKLQKAVKDSDGDRIKENAADVANMAMMLLDVCGGLDVLESALAGSQAVDKLARIGFRYRMKGHADGYEVDDWRYNYHRAPDSFELRECEIEPVWAGSDGSQWEGVGDLARDQAFATQVMDILGIQPFPASAVEVACRNARKFPANPQSREATTPDPAAPDGDATLESLAARFDKRDQWMRTKTTPNIGLADAFKDAAADIRATIAALAKPRQSEAVLWVWNQGGELYSRTPPDEFNAWKWDPLFKHPPTAIPDGMVVVPKEPTQEMLEYAVQKAVNGSHGRPWGPVFWKAMLEKAPTAIAAAPGSAEGG